MSSELRNGVAELTISEEYEHDPLIQWDDHPMARFGWLNKWMLYLMCVPMTSKRTKRSRFCIAVVPLIHICVVSIVMAHAAIYVYISSISGMRDVGLWLISFIWLLISIGAVISSIYLYFKFNYPWNNQLEITFSTEDVNNCYSNHAKAIISSIFISTILAVIAMMIVTFRHSIAVEEDYDILISILWILASIVSYTRVVGILIIHYIICLKYHHYLYNIINNIDGYSLNQLLSDYQTIWKGFKRDYVWSLKWSVWIIVSVAIIEIWGGLYLLTKIQWFVIGTIMMVQCITLYVIPSYALSEKYDELQRILWTKFNLNIRQNDITVRTDLNSLIIYVTKYPVDMKFGPLRLTRKNTRIFAAALVVSKIAAYAISLLY